MSVKNFCFHFGRRCFLNRNLVTIVVAVTASFFVNYFFTELLILRFPSRQNGNCSLCSTPAYDNLALAIADLSTLNDHIDADIVLKEKYANELGQQILSLKSEIIALQQQKTVEETKLDTIQQNAHLIEKKLKVLEANYTPILLPPFRALVSDASNSVVVRKELGIEECSLLSCFDFSRCSLFSSLSVFLYNNGGPSENIGLYKTVTNHSEACIFLYQEDNSFSFEQLVHFNESNHLNHVLIKVGISEVAKFPSSLMVGATSFSSGVSFRKGFDFLLPHVSNCLPNKIVPKLQLLPVKRRIIFSFVEFPTETDLLNKKALSYLHSIKPSTNDVISAIKIAVDLTKHENCQEKKKRLGQISDSTFTIIFHSFNFEFSVVLSEILQSSSIPVVFYSSQHFELPLSDVIDWSKVAVLLPSYRVSEVYYLLKTLSVAEIASYKLEGRRIFEQFYSSHSAVLLGVFASLTRRLHLPPPALSDFEATSAYHPQRFAPTILMESAPFTEDGVEIQLDEYLGPAELPKPSDKFSHNFTGENFLFNAPSSPFQQSPFPHDIALKSLNNLDFRPVGQGLGGSGRQLGLALGGNQPAEQFTIVLLTRGEDRLSILVDIISRFKNLPYLNKVIVVWNDEVKSPPEDLKWPELIVPIFVAKMSNNSLNNRFLPFSEIETDAVLSLDDDMFLRPDEIVFAFRVWRDNRDRIIGFPSRSHGWNSTSQQWVYVSDYSCEYSLVLTGAAFIHKYYFYMYSLLMPAPIRETVDTLMNCEDIAMNFLVSHLTRKSPLKVTVRWTFHCPTCKTHLWKEQTHFNERSECIQRFSDIYGYNPLLFSQSRADSVLFKTRVPSTHQKCFKFV